MLPCGEERCSRRRASYVADVRIAQVHGVGRWSVGKRCSGGDVVDVVALEPFVEGSEAATENGLAVSEEVLREADAGLECVVVGFDQSRGGSILTGQVNAVQIKRAAIDRLQSGAVWSDRIR